MNDSQDPTSGMGGESTPSAGTLNNSWGTCSLLWLLAFWGGMWTFASAVLITTSTLDEASFEKLIGLCLIGFFFGTFGFVIWCVVPVPLVCFLLRRWPRFRKFTLATIWLVLICWGLIGLLFQSPAKPFESITGMDWDLAPCVADFHGSGLQDRRHLWVFQGTPDQFKKHLSGVPWKLDELSRYEDDCIEFRRARQTFGSELWVPTEHHFFYNDRYDDDGGNPKHPHGHAHLWVDAKHERWIIYWDGL
jgi:hypothetical protein